MLLPLAPLKLNHIFETKPNKHTYILPSKKHTYILSPLTTPKREA